MVSVVVSPCIFQVCVPAEVVRTRVSRDADARACLADSASRCRPNLLVMMMMMLMMMMMMTMQAKPGTKQRVYKICMRYVSACGWTHSSHKIDADDTKHDVRHTETVEYTHTGAGHWTLTGPVSR